MRHRRSPEGGGKLGFVLLVGDGTPQPFSEPEAAVLPVPWSEGRFLHHVASDAFYATFDDPESRPQIAVGRFPVRTAKDVETLVEKTLAYEEAPGDSFRRALLVAGDEDQFRQATDELALLLAGREGRKVYVGTDPDPANSAKEAWNEGVGLVHYFGHGTVIGWGRQGELLPADQAALLGARGRTPVVFAMNCLNGAFACPKKTSFAESVLLAKDSGAVAFVGSTSACLPEPQYRLHRLLYPAALSGELRLGEALARSLAEFYDPARARDDGDVMRSWVLLGDPALQVR